MSHKNYKNRKNKGFEIWDSCSKKLKYKWFKWYLPIKGHKIGKVKMVCVCHEKRGLPKMKNELNPLSIVTTHILKSLNIMCNMPMV